MSRQNVNPTPEELRDAAERAISLTTDATGGQRVVTEQLLGGLLRTLARGVLQLQAATHHDKLRPAIGNFTPTEEVVDWYYFLVNAARALDCVVKPNHHLGKHPVDAMIGGTTEDRKNRATVLRALADTIDPLHDEARKRARNPSERLDGIPTFDDFLRMLPDSLRDVLYMDVESEADLEISRLDLIAFQRWSVPSEGIRLLVRARMAWAAAWEHYDHVDDGSWPALEGLNFIERRTVHRSRYYEQARDLCVTILMDPTWLAENKYDEDTLFAKVMAKAPSGRGVLKDVFGVFLNDEIATT